MINFFCLDFTKHSQLILPVYVSHFVKTVYRSSMMLCGLFLFQCINQVHIFVTIIPFIPLILITYKRHSEKCEKFYKEKI